MEKKHELGTQENNKSRGKPKKKKKQTNSFNAVGTQQLSSQPDCLRTVACSVLWKKMVALYSVISIKAEGIVIIERATELSVRGPGFYVSSTYL